MKVFIINIIILVCMSMCTQPTLPPFILNVSDASADQEKDYQSWSVHDIDTLVEEAAYRVQYVDFIWPHTKGFDYVYKGVATKIEDKKLILDALSHPERFEVYEVINTKCINDYNNITKEYYYLEYTINELSYRILDLESDKFVTVKLLY